MENKVVNKQITMESIVDVANRLEDYKETYEEILDAYNTGYTIIFSIKSYGSRIFVEKTEDSCMRCCGTVCVFGMCSRSGG